MKIIKTPQGKTYVHIWRTGTAFETHKKLIYHQEWNNIKFSLLPYASTEFEKNCDIRKRISLPGNTFDAVYANHVLEHLKPQEAEDFIRELYRILKSNGLCRIVVPDLEAKCREYLSCLDECYGNPTEKNIQEYNWSVLDLIDQMVREQKGGLMLKTLKNGAVDWNQIKSTSGDVFNQWKPGFDKETNLGSDAAGRNKMTAKLRGKSLKQMFYAAYRTILLRSFKKDPRKTREANMWMYDKVSLKLLVESQGFIDYKLKGFHDSGIEHWNRYNFDQSVHGNYPLEPSLYIECMKP